MTQTLEALEEQFEKYLFLKISDSTGSIIGSTRGYVEGETSYIGRTFVRPDYQGQGIGMELIKELENRNPAEIQAFDVPKTSNYTSILDMYVLRKSPWEITALFILKK